MRIPRTLVGLFAGMGRGLSGAILQASTRNPLADPGILGINGGAAAAIVWRWCSWAPSRCRCTSGSASSEPAVAVDRRCTSIASLGREGATPVKLALAGAALSAGFYALVSALVLTDVEAFEQLRFWQVGSLAGRYWPCSGRRCPSWPAAASWRSCPAGR